MAESLVDPTSTLTPHTNELKQNPTMYSPPNPGNRSLPTPPWTSPTPHILLCPQSNTSAYEFIEDFCYIISHDPVDPSDGNHLSIPDNMRALWTQIDSLQGAIAIQDQQLNGALQALAALQTSHQNLQNTVRQDVQEAEEEIMTLCYQLKSLRERAPALMPPTPSPASTSIPQLLLNTHPTKPRAPSSEPNLKPSKPDCCCWLGSDSARAAVKLMILAHELA